MSGIFGIWHRDGRPVRPGSLEAIGRRLAHRGSDDEGYVVRGAIGLGCRLSRVLPESVTERQPCTGPEGQVLVFDGRLDNRTELQAQLSAQPFLSSASPDSLIVLAAYREWGEGCLPRLIGDFALALFDPQGPHLLLARDALGIRPLYYWQTRDTLIFASEIKGLLAIPEVPVEPDDGTLADFLLGRVLRPRPETFFQGILSVLPAHRVVISPDRVRIERYWDFEPQRSLQLASFPEYAEAYRGLFLQAVARRLRSRFPVAVSVSGGLDSSSIFSCAETLRRDGRTATPVQGITYISPQGTSSEEQEFVRELEHHYGVQIDRIPVGRPGLLAGATDALWHVEMPLLDELWSTTDRLFQTAQQHGTRVLLSGHWADQLLFGQAYLVDLLRRGRLVQLAAHLLEYPRWFPDSDRRMFFGQFASDCVKHLLPSALVSWLRSRRPRPDRPWYSERLRELARERMADNLIVPKPLASAQAQSLYEEVRSLHHVQCMEWNNKVAARYGMEMAFPFLDRDLIAFLMAVPGHVQTWNGTPKAILRDGMQGILPLKIAKRNWKADFSFMVNAGAEADYLHIFKMFEGHSLAVGRGYVERERLLPELQALAPDLRGPHCTTAWRISEVLALELWLSIFCDGRTADGAAPGWAGTTGLRREA